MSEKPQFVYVTYIAPTLEKAFAGAHRARAVARAYWVGMR